MIILPKYNFAPKEDLSDYLNSNKVKYIEWYEPPTPKEIAKFIKDNYPTEDVFPSPNQMFHNLLRNPKPLIDPDEHPEPVFIYPNIDDNIYLYRKLTESKEYKGLFDPIDFFNILYEQLSIILLNIHTDEQKIRDYLESLNLVKRKLHFLLYSLHYLIKGLNGSVTADRIWPEGISTLKNRKLGSIHINIIDIYQGFEKELGIKTENTDLPNTRPQIMPVPVLIDMKNPVNLDQSKLISIKPTFKPDSIKFIYKILEDFFSKEHQPKLKRILSTGDNSNEILLFKDNGNRLMDIFKKLIEHDFITGCQKKDLASWIVSNFLYQHRDSSKPFTDDYVKKGISRNDYPCKFPLIEIENGKILKTGNPRIKKTTQRNKYL